MGLQLKNSPALATLAHVGQHHQIQRIEVLVSDPQSQYTSSASACAIILPKMTMRLDITFWTLYRGRRNWPSCSNRLRSVDVAKVVKTDVHICLRGPPVSTAGWPWNLTRISRVGSKFGTYTCTMKHFKFIIFVDNNLDSLIRYLIS